MKIKSLFLLFFFSFFNLSAQNDKSLSDLIEAFRSGPELKQASWSLYAINAVTNNVLLSVNPELKLAPASNLKLLTSAAALHYFGPDYRFVTRAGYKGNIENGNLNGDLVIIGGGDPTFCSERFAGTPGLESVLFNILLNVKERGIRRINGAIIIDVSSFEEYLIPDYWPWIDIGNYYGAGVSALCVNENYYTMKFSPGRKEGDSVIILGTEPNLDFIKIQNEVRTGKPGSGDNAYIYFIPFENSIVVKGTVPAGEKEFSIKGNLVIPAKFFAYALEKYLNKNGIVTLLPSKIVKQPVGEFTMLTEFISPRLAEIIGVVNKKSNNLFTEQLLYLLAQKAGMKLKHSDGIEVLYRFLEENKIFNEGLTLFDGCGLSRNNCITTKTIAELLRFMVSSPQFKPFFESLPVAGDENDPGGFRQFGKGTILEKRLFVKSGTINGVRAFSGYLLNTENQLIAFSLIANNYEGSSSGIDKIHREILLRLAETK